MDKYEFKSWKSLAIMAGICLIFLILVIQAFQYIPENSKNGIDTQPIEEVTTDENINENENSENPEEIADENSENNTDNEESESDLKDEYSYRSHRIKSRDRDLDKYTNDEQKENNKDASNDKFETIAEPEELEPILTPEEEQRENFNKMFSKAMEYKYNKDYQNALKTLDSLYKMEMSSGEHIMIAENIANIYTIKKQYSQAIPYAVECYKADPTLEREIFVTKLYYKSGNIEKATNRINMIMQRDFDIRN